MSNERYERGLEVRRAVLGAQHVEKSIKSADDFTRPLQELVTENCWGGVWLRDGLSRKTRSFITLAMLIALNRPHEIKVHLRGALNNGITKDELRELFLHASAYCGWPAAVDGMRVAKEFFSESGG